MNLPTLSPSVELDIINSIIQTVGRTITLKYASVRVTCPVCAGNDPFCPTCSGNGTVDTTLTQDVVANIRWKGSDAKIYRPEGQFMDGDCLVNFTVDSPGMYADLDTLLKKVTTVIVDNRVCVVHNWYFKGSPINRVYLVLKQDESVGGQRIG